MGQQLFRRRHGQWTFIVAVVALSLSPLTHAQPVITQSPQSATVPPGSLVTMSVGAAGAAPLRFRWILNDRELRSRAPTLRFVAGRMREGVYRAVVTDAEGRQTVSAPAEVKVRRRPVILAQPRSTSVREYGTAVFQAVLNNSGPYTTIVWHNDNPLEGSHQIPDGLGFDVRSPRLEIPDCLNADNYNGLYWLAVTNEAGGTVSRKVRLTVIPATQ
jgi:hypothetical protein